MFGVSCDNGVNGEYRPTLRLVPPSACPLQVEAPNTSRPGFVNCPPPPYPIITPTLPSLSSPADSLHFPDLHLSTLTDEQLVQRYRSGHSAAFEELVRRHHDDLIRFLIRLSGNRAVAEDAFQETFLQVHLSLDTFDATRRFKPWLFTIAANKARDALRKSARRRTLDLSAPIAGGGGGGGGGGSDSGARTYVDLMEVDVPQPDQALKDSERSQLVQRAVDELPWSLREILLLAYFQRLSYNQIADSLEIPLGTVKSRLHSAVAAFAKKFQALNPSESPNSTSSTSTRSNDSDA
jgi:RNA polymerase sigma-70 factor (ECF subfamily)